MEGQEFPTGVTEVTTAVTTGQQDFATEIGTLGQNPGFNDLIWASSCF